VRRLDTNVVVRLLIGDDPQQTPIAERSFLEAIATGGVYLPDVVLAEVAWVLRGYALDRQSRYVKVWSCLWRRPLRSSSPALCGFGTATSRKAGHLGSPGPNLRLTPLALSRPVPLLIRQLVQGGPIESQARRSPGIRAGAAASRRAFVCSPGARPSQRRHVVSPGGLLPELNLEELLSRKRVH
jgi:hypothetical protein